MGRRLQRLLGGTHQLIPGQYTTDPLYPSSFVEREVFICCPQCGGIERVTNEYLVDVAGQLIPRTPMASAAWKCPTATCGFFEYILLESWNDLP
jgi:hypothetical protein